MNEKEILKYLCNNEQALKENILKTEDARRIQAELLTFLDKVLIPDSTLKLRFQKLLANPKFKSWWSDGSGYFSGNPWKDMIEPFSIILEQYLAEKMIKRRFSDEEFFVESRTRGEDQHILIGKRDRTGEKAHIIIDGATGEIRLDPKDKAAEEFLSKIETILTLKNGKRIRTTREALEEIPEEINPTKRTFEPVPKADCNYLNKFQKLLQDYWDFTDEKADIHFRWRAFYGTGGIREVGDVACSEQECYGYVQKEDWFDKEISRIRNELEDLVATSPTTFFQQNETVQTHFLDLPLLGDYKTYLEWRKNAAQWWNDRVELRVNVAKTIARMESKRRPQEGYEKR